MLNKTCLNSLAGAALLLITVSGCTKSGLDGVVPTKTKDTVATVKPKALVTAKDTDGNVYHLDTIGAQIWMVENLKVKHYRNGDPIPYSSALLSTDAYCNYNDDESIGNVYGRLYNYYAVLDSRNICPKGFHLPTNEEWLTLETTLGGNNLAGGEMKEAGTTHWNSPNTAATNSSGFTALPGGNLGSGRFADLGNYAYFWADPASQYSRALLYNNESDSGISNNAPNQAFSVRCIKD